MKILPSTLASLTLAAAPGWLAASQGGYSSASCKCEIKCTPDIQRETCAADIVAAIDMQYFTEQKEKSAAEFLSRLENEISSTLGYGSNRQAARFAVFGFSSENDEIQTGLSFLDSVDELKASDIPDKIENIFKSGTINKWAFENDDEQDLGVGIERALDFFKEPHLPAVEEERDDLGFEPTRLLLVLSDGAKKKKSSSLLKAIEAAHENNIKIGAVTLTQMDSPACRRGYVMCPDVEHLTSLSDFVVDGSRAGSAARDVFDFVGQKECYHNGGCKPCNCECDLPRGPAGEEGALGCDGAQGPCGDSGNPGKDGVDGPAGPPGPRGPPGPCGPCGRPGLPGTGGEIGPDGGDGMDGNPGVVGLQGPTGPPGEQGDAGIRGYSGVHGNQGRNGPDGEQGEKGEKGQPGLPGDVLLNVANTRLRREANGMGMEKLREMHRLRRESVAEAISAANDQIRNLGSTADRDAQSSDFFLDQFLEEHGFQTEQWKAYLTSYYSDEVVSTLSTSIREIVVEWMNENMDVINCMLNCGSADCGGGSGNSAGKGGGITVKPLECEEPVDVVFMVDGSDSVSSRDWPKVLTWVTNLVDQISPADREKSSTIVFQDFSMNPATGAIPQEIMGRFDPGDQGSVDDFKAAVLAAKQSAQGTNTYQTLSILLKDDGIFDKLPTVQNKEGATVFVILSDGESRDRSQYYDKKTFDYFREITRMRIAVGVADADKSELMDFAQDAEHLLHYDDFGQLMEAGQEIVDLIQAGCKADTSTRSQALSSSRQLEDFDSDPFVDPFVSSDPFEMNLDFDPFGPDNFLDWEYYSKFQDNRHRA